MRAPAYHLRPNKAADRFALLEAIRRLPMVGNSGGLEDYTYFGMGGPYLEDFRLLYEFCPEMPMVSIEENGEIYKRQKFNLPFRTLKLIKEEMSTYIRGYDPGEDKSIFWLDYTNLSYSCFQDFTTLLEAVAPRSMIKVTLKSDPIDYWHFNPPRIKKYKAEDFTKKFEHVMPNPSANPPRFAGKLANLIQEMLQIASEQVFPPTVSSRSFVPVSSFYYSDGTWMFTLTGIVCDNDETNEVKRVFNNWEFANLEWNRPTRIDVPVLSTKERLLLQSLLPAETNPGSKLQQQLGYLIEDDLDKTKDALTQYAAFHRYSPYFMKGIP